MIELQVFVMTEDGSQLAAEDAENKTFDVMLSKLVVDTGTIMPLAEVKCATEAEVEDAILVIKGTFPDECADIDASWVYSSEDATSTPYMGRTEE